MKETKTNVPAPKAKADKSPAKTKKQEKTVEYKKIPKLYRKEYTEKKLNKKIYNKIYIAEDKEFVQSFIKPVEKNKKDEQLYSVPKDIAVKKSEAARLKAIAKEVKKQKSRIRWASLIAVVAVFAALIITISLTKNKIVRNVITNTCESIFEAKCDIGSVDLRFLDSSFKLYKLEVANKDEPMKNLFQIDSIIFDFDLLQLLKARFVADELSINGFATNTDRTYSGDISAKLQAKIEKKKAKKAAKAAKKTEDSAFMKALKAKSNNAMDTLKSSINGVFDQYNPKNVIEDCYAQLQLPEVSKTVEEETKALVEKYKAMPDKLKQEVESVKATAEKISALDIDKIKSDPVKIKEAIETINTAKTETDRLKRDTDAAVNDIKADASKAKGLSDKLQSAIKHDSDLASQAVGKYTSLTMEDGKNFISDTFDNIGYDYLGKYYPYAKQGVDYLINAKNNNKPKEKKEKKKSILKSTVVQRAPGRTVFYKADTCPKFWIKKAAGSGTNFSFNALNITNDMDKTGKPATANVTLTLKEIDHKANLAVDTRSTSTEPLIYANYNCDKLPFTYPASKFGDAPGIPGVDSAVSNLDFIFRIYEDEGFDISGNGKFTQVALSTNPFEPEFASKIYINTLANIKQMEIGLTAGYTASNGLLLKATSDIDKQFMAALSKELTAQLVQLTNQATEELTKKINELSGGALGELATFDSMNGEINSFADYANALEKQLDNKKKEAEKALTGAAEQKINDAKDSAKDAIKSGIGNLLKK